MVLIECSPAQPGNVLESERFSSPHGALANVINAMRAGLLVLAAASGSAAEDGPILVPPASALRPNQATTRDTNQDIQRIRRCDGSMMAGVVEVISPDSMQIKDMGSGGGIQTVPTSSVLQVVSYRKTAVTEVVGEGKISLKDGGYLNGRSFVLGDNGLSLTMGDQPVVFPRDSVRALQFNNDPSYQTDWRSLVSRQSRNDIIAVKKGPGVLDYLEGIVFRITDDKVKFHLDGQDLNIPRTKLYGVVLAASRQTPSISPLCYIKGSDFTIACKKVSLAEELLTVETTTGAVMKLPSNMVTIDYSPSRTDSLRQLAPRVLKWAPFAGAEEERMFEIMIDGKNEPIRYGASHRDGSSSYDVALNGELSFSVALRGRYSLISTTVEIGQPLEALTIVGDSGQLNGNVEKRIERNVDIRDLSWNVSGMKSVSISVGAGSTLRLNDLRFVKNPQE